MADALVLRLHDLACRVTHCITDGRTAKRGAPNHHHAQGCPHPALINGASNVKCWLGVVDGGVRTPKATRCRHDPWTLTDRIHNPACTKERARDSKQQDIRLQHHARCRTDTKPRTMADTVQLVLERLVPELEDLQSRGLFSEVSIACRLHGTF